MFHQLIHSPSNFAGLVLSSDEGEHIAKCLGNKKAALLGNHGLLTVGKTIEEVTAWFVLLDKCCKVQLLADASVAGSGKPLVTIGKAECESTWTALDGNGKGGYCKSPSIPNHVVNPTLTSSLVMGLPLFQVAEKEFGERTLLGRGITPL